MNRQIYTIITLCLLLNCSLVFAKPQDSYKLATVDINKILNELDEAKDLKESLDKKSESVRKKITDERDELKEMEEDLKAKAADRDSSEVDAFRNKAREFERMVKDSEDELRREFLKVNNSLTEKVLNAIKAYARNNKINLVLDSSESGRSPVLFGNPDADITDTILDSLND